MDTPNRVIMQSFFFMYAKGMHCSDTLHVSDKTDMAHILMPVEV